MILALQGIVVSQKWGGPWVEKLAHFGARTTQRVEGARWQLKRILNTPGKLSQLFKSYHLYLKSIGSISHFAIRMITTEFIEARGTADSEIVDDCTCETRVNYRLPCQHISRMKTSKGLSQLVIDPDALDLRWHLRIFDSRCSLLLTLMVIYSYKLMLEI